MKNIKSYGVTLMVTEELKLIDGGKWYYPILAIYDAAMDGWNFGTWLADQACSHEGCN
jgi:hypothetical protein